MQTKLKGASQEEINVKYFPIVSWESKHEEGVKKFLLEEGDNCSSSSGRKIPEMRLVLAVTSLIVVYFLYSLSL